MVPLRIEKVNISIILYIFIFPNILIFVRFFKLIILCRFFGRLFLPEFLSNQHEICARYSQSSQEVCYNFSIVFFRIYPWFSGSLYSWMAKGSFCPLVKWADTVLCCSSNAKGRICWLVKWADTAFWLARQYAYNKVLWLYNGVYGWWFSIHCEEGEQGAPMSRPTPPFSL